jgi:deoxyribonuclease-4
MYKQRPLLGFHASTSGGLYKALEEAGSLKCPTVQLFTKNNRTWNEPSITPEMVDAFVRTRKQEKIDVTISHASYLINLASAKPEVRDASINAIQKELARSSLLGIDYVVLHPGSHTGHTFDKGIKFLTEACNQILENNYSATLLLETMAGQGSSIGRSFEELAKILHEITYKEKVGICLDTCHVFAAGHPLATDEDYNNLFNEFDATCGIKNLKVIHLNDSKKECGSLVDRHEHIGEGKININFFKNIINDPRLECVSKILETPKSSLADDVRNIETLLKLVKKNR